MATLVHSLTYVSARGVRNDVNFVALNRRACWLRRPKVEIISGANIEWLRKRGTDSISGTICCIPCKTWNLEYTNIHIYDRIVHLLWLCATMAEEVQTIFIKSLVSITNLNSVVNVVWWLYLPIHSETVCWPSIEWSRNAPNGRDLGCIIGSGSGASSFAQSFKYRN